MAPLHWPEELPFPRMQVEWPLIALAPAAVTLQGDWPSDRPEEVLSRFRLAASVAAAPWSAISARHFPQQWGALQEEQAEKEGL
jgi:hypothetical protein